MQIHVDEALKLTAFCLPPFFQVYGESAFVKDIPSGVTLPSGYLQRHESLETYQTQLLAMTAI
jgi:hypothetical protein